MGGWKRSLMGEVLPSLWVGDQRVGEGDRQVVGGRHRLKDRIGREEPEYSFVLASIP